MRIDQIEFTNFKCFDELTLKFHPNFNVIIGDNGFGKSSFLKGLSVSISAFLNCIDEASNRNIERNDIRYEYSNGQPKYHLPVKIETWSNVLNGHTHWLINKISKEGESVFNDFDTFKILKNKLSNLDNNIQLPIVAYYPAGRIWNDIPEKEKKYKEIRFSGYYNALKPTANYKFLTEWLIKMKKKSIISDVDKFKFNIVKSAIVQCIEKAEDIEYNEELQILIMKMKNSNDMPFNRLSDGYRNTLAIISDIAFRCVTLNPFLGTEALMSSGVVLIDEIDLHLHPTWQKQIVNDLKTVFPNIQFFATTHSPFIIQELEQGELIKLKEQKQIFGDYYQQSIEDIAENVQGVANPQWSKKRENLFKTAEEYFSTLELLSKQQSAKEKTELRVKLDTLLKPFADNLAFVAFLEQQRIVKELNIKNNKK